MMLIKSIKGKILFEGNFHSVKRAVECAAREGVSLAHANLRSCDFAGAKVDGVDLNGACLWGSNFSNADMTGANLNVTDCRNSNFENSCLAEARCNAANFHGSYFTRSILQGCDLSAAQFSCPSIFNNDLVGVVSLKQAIYTHKGETDCDLSRQPIVIKGLPKTVIVLKNEILIGNDLYSMSVYNELMQNFLTLIQHQKNISNKALK